MVQSLFYDKFMMQSRLNTGSLDVKMEQISCKKKKSFLSHLKTNFH